jgi:hypothetical protein
MTELKITKERILEAASKCSTAKETLKTLFPEAFESKWSREYREILCNGKRVLDIGHYSQPILYEKVCKRLVEVLNSEFKEGI